jgi:hypothetical protein
MRRVLLCTAALALGLGGFATPTASAGDDGGGGGGNGDDRFTCRASGIRGTSPLINSEPIIANGEFRFNEDTGKFEPVGGDPCADDFDQGLNVQIPSSPTAKPRKPPCTKPTLLDLNRPLVCADVVTAQTDNEDDVGEANASAANVVIVLGNMPGQQLAIQVRVLTSHAEARCVDNKAVLAGNSEVVGLNINGNDQGIITDNNQTIPLGPLGFITANEQTKTDDKITQRALHIKLLPDTPGESDVVVAESIADVHGDPCAPPPPECSDKVDNDKDGLVDEADPGCHTDGDPNNPGSYDPNDDDETDEPKLPQCSDGVDNDDDKFIDFPDDPGCESADDDDETDPPKS